VTVRQRTFFPPLIGLTVGGTILAAGVGMVVCALIGFSDGEAGPQFAISGGGCVAVGTLLLWASMSGHQAGLTVRPATGFLAVFLAWVIGSAAGAIPLLAAGVFSSPLDAYFEAVSGFTTGGATLLPDVEAQPDAVLAWRSTMQWLGGIGIIVLVVAVAPVTGPGIQRVFYAETTATISDRLTPRIIDTAKIIAGIYLVLTSSAAIAYLLAGMGPFDAVNHAMTTLATGGFSTRNRSIGSFDSVAIELVVILFMLIGGINLAFYWRVIRGKQLRPQSSEVLAFFGIVAGTSAAVAVSFWLAGAAGDGEGTLDAVFGMTSVISSTGYATTDFNEWNSFARTTILVAMFIGACAGSTAGGLKVIRVMLLGKAALQELQLQLRPNAVRVLRVGGHVYSEGVRRAVLGFFLIYVLVYAAGVVMMAASGLEPLTAISAASASLNVIGIGFGEIGAFDNFEILNPFARVVSCVLMIAGRLEVFTVVALLAAFYERIREIR